VSFCCVVVLFALFRLVLLFVLFLLYLCGVFSILGSNSFFSVHQVVLDIAAAMHFKASMVTMIGLRIPQKLLESPDISAVVDELNLRSEASFPFLESSQTVRHYRKLILLLEYLDYRYPSAEEVDADDASLSVVAPEERLLDPVMWKTPDKEGWCSLAETNLDL
jgi:hypothetical protein